MKTVLLLVVLIHSLFAELITEKGQRLDFSERSEITFNQTLEPLRWSGETKIGNWVTQTQELDTIKNETFLKSQNENTFVSNENTERNKENFTRISSLERFLNILEFFSSRKMSKSLDEFSTPANPNGIEFNQDVSTIDSESLF